MRYCSSDALIQQRRDAHRAVDNRKLGVQMQVDERFSHNHSWMQI